MSSISNTLIEDVIMAPPSLLPTPPSEPADAVEQAPVAVAPKNVFDMFKLNGKVAVVTGGARGLGYSMIEGLSAAGLAGVAILDLQSDLGEQACATLHKTYGLTARFYRVDVRDEQNVNDVFDSIIADFGKIDILINSAGVADLVHAEDYSPAKFKRVIDINLNGSFICAQAAGKHMIAAGNGGSIIFIGSMSGSIVNWPQPQSAYNASKAGVIHLMKSLAAEWAQHRIRCNSISPGYMDTPLNYAYEDEYFGEWKGRTPMKRLGKPEELAGCALWLASDAASFCTGTDVLIDGGYTIL
ncbi:hypothetical protein V1514DRAFT_47767 [Lipomyces japonicus]|uniref:uncharacterized protein n=1 Tax=Lipomyces japonicus TaxID=56871 RepID=UPI0034CF1941